MTEKRQPLTRQEATTKFNQSNPVCSAKLQCWEEERSAPDPQGVKGTQLPEKTRLLSL